MRREFICHRCGTANRRGTENCRYCGLQVGWRPRIPGWILLWQWPARLRDSMGSLAAPLAVAVELSLSGAWATYLLTLPLLTLSSALLVCHTMTGMTGDGSS